MIFRFLSSLRPLLRSIGLDDWAIRLFKRTVVHWSGEIFHRFMIWHTAGYTQMKWLGKPIWQPPLDLWIIQETIWEVQPHLILETGTNRGGSAFFYAQLFDLMGIDGKVVTVDVEKMHDLQHPRVDYLIGSSTSDEIVDKMRAAAEACEGPVMVFLDSDHSEEHVRRELELYAPFVTPESFFLVQDTVIDTHASMKASRPGPLPAVEKFLKEHSEFDMEAERSLKFLISHHPRGWLRRKAS